MHLEAREDTAAFNSPGRWRSGAIPRVAVGPPPVCYGAGWGRGPRLAPGQCFQGPAFSWLGTRTEGVPGARTRLAWALGSERAGGCWHRPGVSTWVSGGANSPASDAVRWAGMLPDGGHRAALPQLRPGPQSRPVRTAHSGGPGPSRAPPPWAHADPPDGDDSQPGLAAGTGHLALQPTAWLTRSQEETGCGP